MLTLDNTTHHAQIESALNIDSSNVLKKAVHYNITVCQKSNLTKHTKQDHNKDQATQALYASQSACTEVKKLPQDRDHERKILPVEIGTKSFNRGKLIAQKRKKAICSTETSTTKTQQSKPEGSKASQAKS